MYYGIIYNPYHISIKYSQCQRNFKACSKKRFLTKKKVSLLTKDVMFSNKISIIFKANSKLLIAGKQFITLLALIILKEKSMLKILLNPPYHQPLKIYSINGCIKYPTITSTANKRKH
jgi:hypothetical protein